MDDSIFQLLISKKEIFKSRGKIRYELIYISGSGTNFRIYASLTGIEPKQMFDLTGSGITE